MRYSPYLGYPKNHENMNIGPDPMFLDWMDDETPKEIPVESPKEKMELILGEK